MHRNEIDIMNDPSGDIDSFLGVNEYSNMEIDDGRGSPTPSRGSLTPPSGSPTHGGGLGVLIDLGESEGKDGHEEIEVHIYVHTNVCVCMYKHICMYVYTYVYICMYVYVFMYTYIYVCIYIYMHLHELSLFFSLIQCEYLYIHNKRGVRKRPMKHSCFKDLYIYIYIYIYTNIYV
jgi:hypothetical protein